MSKEIIGIIGLDMDGTIADLYNVPNWLGMIQEENALPYLLAEPMCPIDELNKVLNELIMQGWEVRIISWLSKEAKEPFKKQIRKAKKSWLHRYGIPYTKINLVQYGTLKSSCIRHRNGTPAFLIDDDKKIRDSWKIGEALDPAKKGVIEILNCLLEKGNIAT